MLKYRSNVIGKFLNKLKKIETGKFNTKVVYIETKVDEIIINTKATKLHFKNIKTLNNKDIEIWNAGQKLYTCNTCDYIDIENVDLVNNNLQVIIKGNLTHFNCDYNQLTYVDLSKTTKLKEFSSNNNSITSIILPKNTTLMKLKCSYNNLTELNITTLVNLESLECSYNKLTNLNINKNINLKFLDFSNNNISLLNLDKNVKLNYLLCINTLLSSIDISKNINLRYVNCFNCKFSLQSIIDILKCISKIRINGYCCLANNTYNDFTKPQELVEALNAAKAKGWNIIY